MTKKKLLLPILWIVLFLQLLAPVGLILYQANLHKTLEEKGEIYRLNVQIYSIETGKVYYNLTDPLPYYDIMGTEYIRILPAEDGYMRLHGISKQKPQDGSPYIRVRSDDDFPMNRSLDVENDTYQYINYWGNRMPELFWDTSQYDLFADGQWYLEIKVYKGNCKVLGLFNQSRQSLDTVIAEQQE